MVFDMTPYELLKKSKQQEALNKKSNTINALQTQQSGVENTYKDLADQLARRRSELVSKNTADNQNLDSQLQTGNEKYMQERDQGVIANTNQNRALMDWYAKHNIANSTASADELGRQATTLANTLGGINSDKNNFETGISNNRNLLNLDYENGVNDLVNQDNAAQRDKAQKLAEILSQITGAENTYNSEVQSVNDSVEAQKLKDLNDYNLQQQQLAASIAKARSSGTSSSATTKSQKEADTNAVWNELYNQIDNRNAESFLQSNRDAIIANLGSSEYQKMLKYAKDYVYSPQEVKQYAGRNFNSRPITYTE